MDQPISGPLLAATDFSTPARRAAERAAQLAAAIGAPLELLHGLDAPALEELRFWFGVQSDAEHGIVQDARRRLGELAVALRRDHGIEVRERLTEGARVREIRSAAEALGAQAVVLGHTGAHFWRLSVGSTAEGVLRGSRVPVLAVRQAVRGPYRRVLVPLDFSAASVQALAACRRLLPQAHLVLLHVVQAPFQGKLRLAGVPEPALADYLDQAQARARAQLEEQARQHGLSPAQWTACLADDDPALAVVRQELAHDCDLVAIGRQGRHPVDEVLLGSVTRHVLAESQSDVLVVPPR